MRKYEVWAKGSLIVSVVDTKIEARAERKKLQEECYVNVYIRLIKGHRRISDYYQGGY